MLIDRTTKLRVLAWIVGGAISLNCWGGAEAADGLCDTPCDSCPSEVLGCDSCGSDAHCGHHLISGMQKLHQSFQRLCDLNWQAWRRAGHGGSLCDDACDSAMMEILTAPSMEVIHHDHLHLHEPQVVPLAPPEPDGTIVPPVRIKEGKAETDLFDTLPDPFKDDNTKIQSQRIVRPSSHHEIILLPPPEHPLSKTQSSRRQLNNSR